jgi:hypothetical protein
VKRNYRRSLADRLDETRDHIAEAHRHNADVSRALRREDYTGAARLHRELGRCLDRCERCLRAISNDGMHADQEATSKAQNSDGMGYGTFGGGRTSLDYSLRQLHLMQLSGPVAGDRGAVGVQRIRECEFRQRLARPFG